jgi:hypothetical protein
MFMLKILSLFGSAVLALPVSVPAGAAQQLSHDDARRIIKNIEKGSDRFEDSLDAAMNRGGFETSARESAKRLVEEFEDAADVLENNFDEDDAAVPAARAVLKHAAAIDEFVATHGISGRAAEDWRRLRMELDKLSRAYAVNWTWPVVVIQSAPQAAEVPMPGVVVERDPSQQATVIIEQPRASIPYRLSHEQMKGLMERIESHADAFRSSLGESLENSRLDDTNAEDRIKQYVKDFENVSDQLEDRYDDDNAAVDSVKEVLRRAAGIDQFMQTHNMSARSQSDWSKLRADLDELAAAYNGAFDWTTAIFVLK